MCNRNHAFKVISAISFACLFAVLADRYKASKRTQAQAAIAGLVIGALLPTSAGGNSAPPPVGENHELTDITNKTAFLLAVDGTEVISNLRLGLTVAEITSRLKFQRHPPYERPRLWWNGTKLETPNRTLASYGVNPSDTLQTIGKTQVPFLVLLCYYTS